MESITSRTGQPHVTSTQFRAIMESLVGSGSYIADMYEQLEPELAANNTVRINSGILVHHGHIMRVPPNTYDPVTYLNGSQGMKRIDLVVARYTKEGDTESSEWVVIQGTPDAANPAVPAYTEGNMQDGDLVDDCPVLELHFDGINVTEVKKLVPVAKNISGLESGKANSSHTHDDRYYTETEIDSKLNGKANSSHTHDDRYYTETEMNSKLNALDNKIVAETTTVTTNANWSTISKSGHTLLSAHTVRDDSSCFIKGINRRSNGMYTLLFDGITTATQVTVYAVWSKNDAV